MAEICLAFDASARHLQVGVFDPAPRAQFSALAPRESFQRLMPEIQRALAQSEVQRPDWILCCCGPGSFTGIRVTLAAARGLAQAWSIPVLAVGTFSYYLYSILLHHSAAGAALMMDARQRRVYAAAAPDLLALDSEPDVVDIAPGPWLEARSTDLPVYVDDVAAIRALIDDRSDLQSRLQEMPPPQLDALYALAERRGGLSAAGHWSTARASYVRTDPAHARYPMGLP